VDRRIVVVLLCLVSVLLALDQGSFAQTTTDQRVERPSRVQSSPSTPTPGVGVTFADNTTQVTAAFGTITGVTPGSGLTGGGTSGSVSLAVDTTVARTAGGNSLVGNQAITGNLVVTGNIQINGNGNGLTFADASKQTTAATGGGGTLSGTVNINSGTTISSGSCTNIGVTVTGATSSMVAVISPTSDPSAKGLHELLWDAYVDSTNHVTARFCHFANSTASATAAQTFNIRVIP